MSIALDLLDKLVSCLAKSSADNVDLETYINLWSDLGSVLSIMGSVFKFVKSDVDDKGTLLIKNLNLKNFSRHFEAHTQCERVQFNSQHDDWRKGKWFN